MLRFVGDGDQKKVTNDPRHFSMQNSQASSKSCLESGQSNTCDFYPLSEVPQRGCSKRGRTQKHAKEHKRKSAKECKGAQKGKKQAQKGKGKAQKSASAQKSKQPGFQKGV